MLTTSSSDGEALNAIRKANELLKSANKSWSDVISGNASSRLRDDVSRPSGPGSGGMGEWYTQEVARRARAEAARRQADRDYERARKAYDEQMESHRRARQENSYRAGTSGSSNAKSRHSRTRNEEMAEIIREMLRDMPI